MTLEKKLMTIKELVAVGFSEKALRAIYEREGWPIAFKEGGATSQIKFDTEELLKHIAKREAKAKARRGL